MRKGFSLLEILVALAIFGILSGLVLNSLLGLFRVNRATGSEARAVTVAKNYLEMATKKAEYSKSDNVLYLPAPTQTAGFEVRLAAGGRLPDTPSVTLTECTPGTNAYSCPVNCTQNGETVRCSLVTIKLTLTGGGKTYDFYREWTP